ncbi:XisI protein [Calothrix sp. PCC 6303]|uniref:XisI protein n=1 Tax=Calothrix sp. PCC 6303 TaxID=1170562 RepID=UPI0002A01DDD|nr:XisI protein [Calothrix sp. PCC 6303]AFZ02000.1 XisI protein [Calothrix sp. PCC 6303]
MDKLDNYRNYIKNILQEYQNWAAASVNEEYENSLIFDTEHDQYLWVYIGWQGKKRLKGTNIHLRIKNEKIWIEEDWTEEGIANELVKLGVPHQDIVLAFYPAQERKLTEFASA